jgi:pyruvate kinase
LRIGHVKNHQIELREGDAVHLVTQECTSTPERLFVNYPELASDVKPGDNILIDDGKIHLEVTGTNHFDTVHAIIRHGGILTSKKGVNFPNTKISQPSLTDKDLHDASFALENDVDWIALSFVRSATDMADLRDLIRKKKKNTRMIAKIEKPEALKEIDNIIDVSNGIMIARGDLGVEVSFDQLPMIQKNIIQKCINQAKPVIIATQMMESMIEHFRPTRAETNDVANAVLDGADCLMLSGETSIGKYPVEVIRSMRQIISWTEKNGFHYIREHAPTEATPSFLPDTISYHASQMAELSRARAIITFTHSGYTSLRISSHRPSAQIYAFTNNLKILQSLSVIWGVRPRYVKTYENINEAIANTIEILKTDGHLQDGDVVVHLGSIPLNMKGQTNMMKISYV